MGGTRNALMRHSLPDRLARRGSRGLRVSLPLLGVLALLAPARVLAQSQPAPAATEAAPRLHPRCGARHPAGRLRAGPARPCHHSASGQPGQPGAGGTRRAQGAGQRGGGQWP